MRAPRKRPPAKGSGQHQRCTPIRRALPLSLRAQQMRSSPFAPYSTADTALARPRCFRLVEGLQAWALTPALSRCRPRKPVWPKPVPGSRLERVVGLHATPSKLPERPVAKTYRTTPAVTNRSPGVRRPNPKCQPHDAEAPPSDAAWAKRPPNGACRWSACAAAHCAGPR